MITLIEFLSQFKKATNRDKILGILFYKKHHEKKEASTVSEIRDSLKLARISKWKKINISNILIRAGEYVHYETANRRQRLWKLTQTGEFIIKDSLENPIEDIDKIHDIVSLSNLISKINDRDVKDYIDEALKCFKVGALRAVVVFLWSGCIRLIQQIIMTFPTNKINQAAIKHDPKAHSISKIDDFSYVKDKVTLLVAQDLGIFDKNEKDTLQEALNLRNRCGHPSKYKLGPKKVSSFIEDLFNIVFQTS